VFRGSEAEKLDKFIVRLREYFPEIEIIHDNGNIDQLRNSPRQHARIHAVKPSCQEEMEGRRRTLPADMPSPIKRFHANTNTNVFTFSIPYRLTPTTSPMKNEHRVRRTTIAQRNAFDQLFSFVYFPLFILVFSFRNLQFEALTSKLLISFQPSNGGQKPIPLLQ
jgi:hypothetical protein